MFKLVGSDPFGLKDARFGALDGLRAIAVLMVFNVHFFGHYVDQRFLLDATAVRHQIAVLRAGHVGVDLFFIISGFLMYRALRVPRPGFLRDRVLRLAPVHMVSVCIYALAFERASMTPQRFVENFLLVAPAIPGHQVYGLIWSLSWECTFYVLIFAIARSGIRGPLRTALGIAGLAAITLAATRLVGLVLFDPARFVVFLYGIALAAWLDRGRLPSAARSNGILLAGAAALLGLQVLWSREAPDIQALPADGGFYVAVGAVFTVILRQCFIEGSWANRAFAIAPLRWLGRISYSFFLLHISVIGMALRALPPATSLGGMWARYAIVLALSMAVAGLSYLLLERPYFERQKRKALPPLQLTRSAG